MSELLDTACTVFGVTPDELRGPSRERRIAHARFAVAWALRKHDSTRSFRAIGEALGGRDHSTILYRSSELRNWRARMRIMPVNWRSCGHERRRKQRAGNWSATSPHAKAWKRHQKEAKSRWRNHKHAVYSDADRNKRAGQGPAQHPS